MLETLARRLTLLHLPIDRIVAVVTVGGFLWLLLDDRIHPLAICLLQAYLSF